MFSCFNLHSHHLLHSKDFDKNVGTLKGQPAAAGKA